MVAPGLTPTERAYLAGFFDGEGCIESNGRTVGVTNTYPDILYRFQRYFGGKVAPKTDNSRSGRDQWRWSCSGPDARHFLYVISPNLTEKRSQAETFLNAWSVKTGTPEHLRLLMRLRDLKHINYPHPETSETV